MDLSAFPRAPLGIFPTPLQRVHNLERATGHDCLYFKRDDLTGLSLGGNKTRSLQFLLGDAISKGSTAIVTAGGLQSNLCSLTAAASARCGMKCVLVHNDTAPGALTGNMLLNRIFGAREVFIGKTDEQMRTLAMENVAEQLKREGETPYIIYNGASTPLGALGYLSAALELHEQSQKLDRPVRHVAMVGAMGGTASGFVFGTAMRSHPFHVHVISVEYPKEVLHGLIHELCEGISELTGIKPAVPIDEVMTITDRYLGEGYAIPSTESLSMLLTVARTEGILLENVYTSKTVLGLCGLISDGTIPRKEAACYVHTGGLGSLFAQQVMTG